MNEPSGPLCYASRGAAEAEPYVAARYGTGKGETDAGSSRMEPALLAGSSAESDANVLGARSVPPAALLVSSVRQVTARPP